MTGEQQAAVARLGKALEGYERNTRYERPGKVSGRASGGSLVEVAAQDLAAACEIAVPPPRCTKAAELAAGVGRALEIHRRLGPGGAAPRTLMQADDLFLLLDQMPAAPAPALAVA